jgi:hypothetical protein
MDDAVTENPTVLLRALGRYTQAMSNEAFDVII